jgi:hypothetical protein
MNLALAVLFASGVLVLGALVSAAAFPGGTLSLPTRIASFFGLGCAAVALTGVVLAVVHLLTAAWTLVALVLLAAGLAIRVRPQAPIRHLSGGVRRCVLNDGWAAAGGAGVLFVFAIARLGVSEGAVAGGWRYWADGLELAGVGHVPDTTLQWGMLTQTAVSKLAANAFAAEVSFVLERHPFAGMAVLLWLSAVGTFAGLWALGWELGLRWAAPLLPLLALSGHSFPAGIAPGVEMARNFEFFQDEDLGIALAAVGAALAVAGIKNGGSRRAIAAAGGVLTAGALSHLIPVLVIGALVACYVVTVAVGRHPRRLRPILVAGAILVVPAVLGPGLLAAAGADVGLGGASNEGGYHAFKGRYDPTLAFDGRLAPPRPKSAHRWYRAPTTTAHEYLQASLGERPGGWSLPLAAVGTAVLVAAAMLLARDDLRLAPPAAAGMAAMLLVAGLAFSYAYALYVPATFGVRRLFEYGDIPFLLIVLVLLEAIVLRLARVDVRVPAVAAALAVAAVVGAAGLHSWQRNLGPMVDYITAARTATRCNSRLLPDVSTRGAFQALTGRASLLEGLAPFLRPPILTRVLGLSAGAHEFFDDPRGRIGFLAREHVDDVLVHRGRRGRRWAAFDAVPQLELVREVGGVRVYGYDGPDSTGGARPEDAPGYRCQSGRLP